MSARNTPDKEWVPLLVPDMPSPQTLLPWLERMHAAKHYSNFGPLVRELEAKFAQQFEIASEQITTVANATLGLELVLQALDLPPNSRVLVPAFTFVATATAVLRAGHVPVLADVDADSWMLTPDIARRACTQTQVHAVLPVATFGMPHSMQAWQEFEQETGLPVVIDAAAAYGSQWLKGVEGTLVFSLHTTKSLPAVEGGLVVSNRPSVAARVRQLSSFGINQDPTRQLPVGAITDIGTNAKMSEYHAAVGLASLQVWEAHAQQRRLLQTDLIQKLQQASHYPLRWQAQGNGGPLMAPTLLCVRLPDAAIRNRLEIAFQTARITTRRWYQPLLQNMPALPQYCEILSTPCANDLGDTILGLPFFLGINKFQYMKIIDSFI